MARKVQDPLVVMTLRVPRSVAHRWQVACPDWRGRVRAWMVETAPKYAHETLAEMDARRAAGAAVGFEELEEEFLEVVTPVEAPPRRRSKKPPVVTRRPRG